MIHADALDFSKWHSEEVISFFWRSVYLYKKSVESVMIVYKNGKCTLDLVQNFKRVTWKLCHIMN